MTRAYNVIDADGHILEPLDLWDKYIDPEFRERRPRFVIDDNGKAATVLTVMFFRGLNSLGIGILGEYLWRTFENTKGRPGYVVLSRTEFSGRPEPVRLQTGSGAGRAGTATKWPSESDGISTAN